MKDPVPVNLERAPEIALHSRSSRESLDIKFLVEAISHCPLVPSAAAHENHELSK